MSSSPSKEKKLLRTLLDEKKIYEPDLEEAGYTESEISEIKNGREDFYIYNRLKSSEKRLMLSADFAVNKILGQGWECRYDYEITAKGGRHSLSIWLTAEEYRQIRQEFSELVGENIKWRGVNYR